jgi:integrase
MQREVEGLQASKSYSVKEVSEILGISPRVVRDRIRNKELLAYSEGRELLVLGQHITDYRLSKLPSAGVMKINETDLVKKTVYNLDDLERLFQGGGPMMVKKVGTSGRRWFCGFGGFFYELDKKGFKRWKIWFWDENHKRKHKSVHLVWNEKEALIALKYELEMAREKAFLRKYVPEKAKEQGYDVDDGKRVKFSLTGDDYIRNYAELNHTQIGNDKSTLRNLNQTFGKMYVNEISRGDIKTYVAEQQKLGLKNSTIRQRLRVMRSVLNWAIDMDKYQIKKNPFEGRNLMPKVGKNGQKPLKPEMILALLQKAKESYPHMLPPILMGLFQGMRIGEIETLKKEDINFEDRMLELKPENVKGRKQGGVVKQVPIGDYIFNVLKYLKENTNGDSEYVFTYRNPRFCRTTRVPIRDHFARIVKECGLEGQVRFHQLRRTVANLLNGVGMPIQFTQHLLGHEDPNTTKGYLNADIEMGRKAAAKQEEIIMDRLSIGNLDFLDESILPHYSEGTGKS